MGLVEWQERIREPLQNGGSLSDVEAEIIARSSFERSDRQDERKLDRAAQPFEPRARSRDRPERPWRDALRTGRAPFPRRYD
ncbi:MAG TPA: hypothetical protein VFE09_06750 [Rubrobacteraceae bacterium]|nr:hypothetical protein [Rubrobacteraceae bacterium]